MKQGAWIGFVVALLMAACSSFQSSSGLLATTDPTLTAIDSLLWTQPDSAFTQLQAFAEGHEVDSLNPFNRHYFHLLLSELLYKNYYEQTNRSELLKAVDYYDSIVVEGGNRVHPDLVFLDARSHYIYGVGYYEMDSAVPACSEYLRAVELMEERFSEEELTGERAQVMALACAHLTEVYSDRYLHDQAIYFGKKTLEYYQRYGASSMHIGWALLNVGSRYDIMKSYDEAECYYNKALESIANTNNILYRDIVAHKAFLSYERGNNPQETLVQLSNLLVSAENKEELMARCLALGEVFYHEKEFDSAKCYLQQVFEITTNSSQKKQAAEWLAEICKVTEEKGSNEQYAEFLVPFANYEENSSAIRNKLLNLFEKHTQNDQDRVHQQKKRKNVAWTTALFAGLLMLMIVFIVNIFISKKKRKGLELQNTALSNKLKKGDRKLREVMKQLDVKKKDTLDYTSFIDTPICRSILNITHNNVFKSKIDHTTYQEFALSKEQLLALRVAADEKMNNFTVRLRKRFPELKDEDVNYCCLYMLKLNDAEVAALMQRAYPTVCERKRKIKRLIGGGEDIVYVLCNLQ